MAVNQSNDGDRASTEPVTPDLGSKDIAFLQAIQEVNERAGYRPGAEDRPPATTGEIATAAGLNKNEVNYRLNQRGFDSEGLGYIQVYGPQLLENGALSAKSAELTEKGEDALSYVLESSPSSTSDISEELDDQVAELEAEIEQLREENAALREIVQQFDKDQMGAWNADRERQFEATLNAMVAYQQIFQEVFGIDVSEFRGDGGLSDSTIRKGRQQTRDALQQ